MTVKIQIQTSKGSFLQLKQTPVLSERALRAMRTALDKPERWPEGHPVHRALHTLVPLFNDLPVSPMFLSHLSPDDAADPECRNLIVSTYNTQGTLPVRYWIDPQVAQIRSSLHTFEVDGLTPHHLGWPAAEQIVQHPEALLLLSQAFGLNPSSPNALSYDWDRLLRAAKTITKKAKTWTAFTPDEDTLLVKASSCAIYSITDKGYLNDKAKYGPLASACLFESPGQALRTVQARKLANVAVVNVSLQVTSVAPVLDVAENLGPLSAALARMEGAALRNTFEENLTSIASASPSRARL